MELIAEQKISNRHFIIKHDEAVGFYLYVYESNRCVRDYLQDTLELAIDFAMNNLQVPKESWKQVD
jgi:hypothetical protein